MNCTARLRFLCLRENLNKAYGYSMMEKLSALKDVERVVALEREVVDTRRAAVKMVLRVVEPIGKLPGGRK